MASSNKRELTYKELTDIVKTELSQGDGVEGTIYKLVGRGWPEVSARKFVLTEAQCLALETGMTVSAADERRAEMRAGRIRLIYGLAMALVALGLAALGLSLTQIGSGIFFFAAGVILGAFAIVLVLTGLNCWFSNRS